MKYLKINIEDTQDPVKLKEVILMIKGVQSVEIIDAEHPASELKKAFNKSKEQLEKGEYESLVSDIFDLLTSPNQNK